MRSSSTAASSHTDRRGPMPRVPLAATGARALPPTGLTKGIFSMTTWTSDELDKIGETDELEIASLRRDGTLRKPVIIWVVRYGNDLYVRSGYGHDAAWY